MGFTEIATLMEIAKQQNITAKIEKAKIYRAQQLIKYNIRTLRNPQNNEVGSQVEVELGNAMLREVHKKLLADKTIEQAWPRIPDNIANERLIESFLTPENIQKMLDLVKEALSDTQKSQKDAIDFLCGVETNFWAKTILTKEEQEQTQYKTPEEKVEYENYLKAQNERIENLRSGINALVLDPDNEELIDKKFKEIKAIEENIENKRLTKLQQTLEKKTHELLDQSQQSTGLTSSPNPIGTESVAASGSLGSQTSIT